jgi:hypothetical protein
LPQVAQPSEGLASVIRPGRTAGAGTDEPLAPVRHREVGAVSGSDLGRIGLDLMLAGFAPYDGPDLFAAAAPLER